MMRRMQPGYDTKLAEALVAPDPLAQLIEEPAPGIFTFNAFNVGYSLKLAHELNRFESEAPNTMNRYGRVLGDIGYGSLGKTLLSTLVRPLTRRFYPSVGHLRSVHGFTVSYSKKQRSLDPHTDDSAVTLNVCLCGGFTGGKLVFRRQDGSIACKIGHRVGMAVLHRGDVMHQAQATRSGERTNLILWCRT
jgi:hypothetical protein